ncbi:MAG: trypsin-like peptidase domain-containing protein [Clostridia bacterium]|nr:trypsin-like peptidase domain-containing protein [Clostridia bacterium]
MWSFDDEENKYPHGEDENPGNPPEEPKDDFSERDPFSRGGDFYRNYNGGGTQGAPGGGKRPQKHGLLPAILICSVIVLLTIMVLYMMEGGITLGGIGAQGATTATTVGTTVQGGTQGGSQDGTQGTQATAPGITSGTGTVPSTPSYVFWDPAVVEKCLNASVLITVENVGSGSGVIYTQDGYILTNYHVVSSNEYPISVTLFSGEVLTGTYIYGDESNDISVIKIEKSDCIYAEISASPVTYMMPVMVIGNALGKGFNTTEGVVSAPASEVYFSSTYETMTLIRVDAAVNSGNSGGGLFNISGQLIGIVNAKLSGISSSGATIESMSYAIPMSSVIKCVNDLKEFGYVRGVARLGVSVSEYLHVGNNIANFIVLKSITPGGSAEKAELKEKDILLAVNGTEVTSYETLKRILTAYSVGDSIELTIKRPTEAAASQTNIYRYWDACTEMKITLTFVEFDPNIQ